MTRLAPKQEGNSDILSPLIRYHILLNVLKRKFTKQFFFITTTQNFRDVKLFFGSYLTTVRGFNVSWSAHGVSRCTNWEPKLRVMVCMSWECTSVSEDPASSCSNCRPGTYTEPVITNTRHDICSQSIYHSSTWALDNHDPRYSYDGKHYFSLESFIQYHYTWWQKRSSTASFREQRANRKKKINIIFRFNDSVFNLNAKCRMSARQWTVNCERKNNKWP